VSVTFLGTFFGVRVDLAQSCGFSGGIPLIYRLLTALCLAFVLLWTVLGPSLVGNRGALVSTVARLAR
jgi:hypothetical protein